MQKNTQKTHKTQWLGLDEIPSENSLDMIVVDLYDDNKHSLKISGSSRENSSIYPIKIHGIDM